MSVSHIRLPVERIEQLRLIAEAGASSIPDVIGDFIRSEIERGTIPATIPGIEMTKQPDSITITSKGVSVDIPLGEGPTVADLLRGAGDIADADRKRRWIEGAAALAGVKVKRAGNGLKLVSSITEKEFTLSLSLAVDLADQIERTAK